MKNKQSEMAQATEIPSPPVEAQPAPTGGKPLPPGMDPKNPLCLIHVSSKAKKIMREAPSSPILVYEGASRVPRYVKPEPLVAEFNAREFPIMMKAKGEDGRTIPHKGTRLIGWLNVDQWFLDNQKKLGFQPEDYQEIRDFLVGTPERRPVGWGIDYGTEDMITSLALGVYGTPVDVTKNLA